MNKKLKIGIIAIASSLLLIWWTYLYINNMKAEPLNYWWQVGLAVLSIVAGTLGLLTAGKWSWLKSGVGKGIFFIALGLIMWGLGQLGWGYYTIAYPGQEIVYNKIIDLLYFASIPLWIYGIISLSKATGAKFGLKSIKAKGLVVVYILLLTAISYYLLIVVARGGSSYFQDQTVWNAFFDLAYAIGDAINLILAVVIFGFSWKYLGGKFRKPIVIILFSFALIYVADLLFSYLDGRGLYYNGDKSDLLYLTMVAVMGTGLCSLDPSSLKIEKSATVNTQESNESAIATAATPATAPSEVSIDEAQQVSNNEQLNNNQEES
jgi:hypothetical protein